MGVTANWVGCTLSDASWLTRGFQGRTNEMLQGALHPQKTVASLKSQDLTRMVSVTRVQATRKHYRRRNAAMAWSQISVDTGCCNFTEAYGPHPMQKSMRRYFFPISPSLIQPQHLPSHKRGRR